MVGLSSHHCGSRQIRTEAAKTAMKLTMTSPWKELRSTVLKAKDGLSRCLDLDIHESLQAELAMEREDEDRPE
jgi:hypothetical protein